MANEIFKCKICGGQAKWDPEVQKVKCMFCDTEFELNEFETTPQTENFEVGRDAQELGYVEATDDSSNVRPEDLRVYKCSYCGAEIVTDKTTAATNCVFCNNPVVIEEQLATEFKPKWVIPFKINPRDVEDMYLKYIKKPFTPDSFLSREHIQKIKGVYVPFWLYNVDISGRMQAECDNVRRYSDSKYNYTEHKIYDVRRGGKFKFKKIPVDSSSKTPNDAMDSIEPFNFSEMKVFEMPYLAGFLAERYDETQDDCFERAKIRAEKTTADILRQSIKGYTSVSVKNSDVTIDNIEAEYVMLPTYLLFCKYNNEDYVFALNGQTGKACGNIPVDKKKIRKFFLSRFIGIWGILSAISVLATMILG